MAGGSHKSIHSKLDSADRADKPSLRESWTAIMKTVDTLDRNMLKGYREDIDTLLVFAGLFSGVVTAFTIESYQWLQEDPSDRTNALLEHISQQLHNQTIPPSPSAPPFTPDLVSVQINTFWFLSLTLSLIVAFFALLCKQWVQEHQRQTKTHTPGQDLALRWWRYQSFEKWHGPAILASLPILLELALFLFLAGLLELLWTRHFIPFVIAGVIAGLALLFYLATTILPAISVIREIHQTHPSLKEARLPMNTAKKPYLSQLDRDIIHRVSLKYPNLQKIRLPLGPSKIRYLSRLNLICPYKAPQSWLVFRLFSTVYEGTIRAFRLGHTDILGLADWPSLDLNIIQRFSNIERCPDLYELKGYRWLVQETRNMPSMRPYLKRVLEELPLHLVMPTVFDWWHLPVGKSGWSTDDIDSAMKSSYRIEDLFESAHYYPIKFSHPLDDLFGDQPSAYDFGLASQIICFRNLLATYDEHWARYDKDGETLAQAAEDVWSHIQDTSGNGQLIWVFFRPEDLLVSPWAGWREGILHFYQKHWNKLDFSWQAKLVSRISEFILPFLESMPDHVLKSTVLASKSGLTFFMAINHKIGLWPLSMTDNHCLPVWYKVLGHIWHIHQPDFAQFVSSGYFPCFPSVFQKLLGDSSIMSDSVLGPLLDSYESCWNGALNLQKEMIVKILSQHIAKALSSPKPPPQPQSKELQLSSTTTPPLSSSPSATSPFVSPISQRGLEFLTFVNNRLAEDTGFYNLNSAVDTIKEWEDALEHLRISYQLPSGHFKPIFIAHTMSRHTAGSITETLTGESPTSQAFLGSTNDMLGDGRTSDRAGTLGSYLDEDEDELHRPDTARTFRADNNV